MAGAGDVNHDGRDDVILAAPGNPGFEDEHTVGAAYVVFGRRSVATTYVARLGAGGLRSAAPPAVAWSRCPARATSTATGSTT